MRLKEEIRRETVIRKSRFIACARPVEDEAEARAYIAALQKEFPDASHVCSAYVIGPHNEIQHAGDNGEPAGTAGRPMLASLLASGIQYAVVGVVRYFGGIKLGTGGLVRAYGGCVEELLKDAPRVKEATVWIYDVRFPYELSGSFENWLRRRGEILAVDYGEDIEVLTAVPDASFEKDAAAASHGRARVRFVRTESRFINL